MKNTKTTFCRPSSPPTKKQMNEYHVKVNSVVKPTQKEAIAAAREIAAKLKAEVVVHGVDGKILEKNSYGNDSNPPKG